MSLNSTHHLRFNLAALATATTNTVRSDALDVSLGLPIGTIERTGGVVSRQVLPRHISQSAFAAMAVRAALSQVGMSADQLALILSASAVPEQAIPSTASLICHELGIDGVSAYDVNASCLSFITALYNAIHLLPSHTHIAVVASDVASRGLNWQDTHTAAIFGDGAVAALIRPYDDKNNDIGLTCLAYRHEVYPAGRYHCQIRAGGTRANAVMGMSDADFYFDMDGQAVFRLAMTYSADFVGRLLADAGLGTQDINAVIMHQASHLGIKHAISRLGFSPDKIINIYPTHGNQVSASIPSVLHHAHRTGKLHSGARLALLGTAAGFGIGGMILQVR